MTQMSKRIAGVDLGFDDSWTHLEPSELVDLVGGPEITITGHFSPPSPNIVIVGGVRTRRRARQLGDGRHTVILHVLAPPDGFGDVPVVVRKIYRLKQRRRGRV
jgi:hypothetical protein